MNIKKRIKFMLNESLYEDSEEYDEMGYDSFSREVDEVVAEANRDENFSVNLSYLKNYHSPNYYEPNYRLETWFAVALGVYVLSGANVDKAVDKQDALNYAKLYNTDIQVTGSQYWTDLGEPREYKGKYVKENRIEKKAQDYMDSKDWQLPHIGMGLIKSCGGGMVKPTAELIKLVEKGGTLPNLYVSGNVSDEYAPTRGYVGFVETKFQAVDVDLNSGTISMVDPNDATKTVQFSDKTKNPEGIEYNKYNKTNQGSANILGINDEEEEPWDVDEFIKKHNLKVTDDGLVSIPGSLFPVLKTQKNEELDPFFEELKNARRERARYIYKRDNGIPQEYKLRREDLSPYEVRHMCVWYGLNGDTIYDDLIEEY